VKLTGVPTEEIRQLATNGTLPAHKAHRGHWRLNVPEVEKYFGIQINKPVEESEEKRQPPVTRLITENFYKEVIERIGKAKTSVKIMTGDFKRFNLTPTAKQGKRYKDGTPFLKHILQIAEKNVSVHVIFAHPSERFKVQLDKYREKMPTRNFHICYCKRNHAKVVIIDDKFAYIGSANLTPAGLAQGVISPGNFEVGFLTEEPTTIATLNNFFSQIESHKFCAECHRTKICMEKKWQVSNEL
jgi:phosphatidylserine/phosphatidylglycerophosphate/cardiolipin synthase-like enzyme